ncbi:MAG: WXG100 family type VII secretion target [Actinomycetota bacterium]
MPGPNRPGGADGFDVVPAALRGAAGTFVSEADALADANAALYRHLSSLGGAPWGSDAVGMRFGSAYQPAADAVIANIGALTGGLARISAALVAVADRYEQADQSAVPVTSGSTRRSGDRTGGRGRSNGDVTRTNPGGRGDSGRDSTHTNPSGRRTGGGSRRAHVRGRRR